MPAVPHAVQGVPTLLDPQLPLHRSMQVRQTLQPKISCWARRHTAVLLPTVPRGDLRNLRRMHSAPLLQLPNGHRGGRRFSRG